MKTFFFLFLILIFPLSLNAQQASMPERIQEINTLIDKKKLGKADAVLEIEEEKQELSLKDKLELRLLRAKIQIAQTNFTASNGLLKDIIKQSKANGWELLEAKSKIVFATLMNEISEFQEAQKLISEALPIIEQRGDEKLISTAYIEAADVLSLQRDANGSIEYLQKALEVLKSGDYPQLSGHVQYNISNHYLKEGDLEQASSHIEQAEKLFAEAADDYALMECLLMKAAIANNANDYDQAIGYYETLMRKIENGEADQRIQFDCYRNLAGLYFNLKKDQLALDYVNKALNAKHDLVDYDQMQDLYETRAWTQHYLKQYQQSFESFQKQIAYKDSLLIELEALKGETLKILLEKEKRKVVEAELEQAKLEKEAEAKAKWVVVLLFSLFLAVVSIFILFQRNQFAQKQATFGKLFRKMLERLDSEKDEAKKKERKRISDSLHDKVSSQLAAVKWVFEGKIDDFRQNRLEPDGLDSILGLLEETYTETRRLSREIETMGPSNRIQLLQRVCREVAKSQKMDLDFRIKGFDQPIPFVVEDHLFSITMVLISNALENAFAKNIEVVFERTADTVFVRVEDDGRGFDKGKVKMGYGIRNMYERVESMDGKVDMFTQKGKGTKVEIRIPVKESWDEKKLLQQ